MSRSARKSFSPMPIAAPVRRRIAVSAARYTWSASSTPRSGGGTSAGSASGRSLTPLSHLPAAADFNGEIDDCRRIHGIPVRAYARGVLPDTLQLDRYELRDRLGRGGMATVYRAYDRELERFVA